MFLCSSKYPNMNVNSIAVLREFHKCIFWRKLSKTKTGEEKKKKMKKEMKKEEGRYSRSGSHLLGEISSMPKLSEKKKKSSLKENETERKKFLS